MNTAKKMLAFAAMLLISSAAFAGGLPDRQIRPQPVTAQIKALQAEVAALQKQMARLPFGHVQAQTNSGIHINALTDPIDTGNCADIGLLLGNAQGANVALGHIATRITCELYEYSYSTVDGSIAPLPGMEWDGANCSGSFYATQTVTPQLAQNGYVFSMPGITTTNYAVAADSTTTTITVMSQSDEFGDCFDNSDSAFSDDVYIVILNVPLTTGVPNSAVPTKITNGGT